MAPCPEDRYAPVGVDRLEVGVVALVAAALVDLVDPFSRHLVSSG